jgi:RNA polymerase sigma factor (sigma-70 family)
MAQLALRSVARQLGSLFDLGSVAGLSDRQLLERFTASRAPADEAAFAALVARHGPMVLGVCRKLLGDHHHAEDAFQAVFLVLARQANSIRNPEMLGAWLYGVARRTAGAARGRIASRERTEMERAVRQPIAGPALAADRAVLEHEQSDALHREINALPGVFRAPLELCYFEGLTLDEAAHRLQWRPGPLRSRLARARVKLRRGLIRGGFVPPAAATARADDRQRPPLAILPPLCDSTARAAVQFASGRTGLGPLSEFAEAIAREVLTTLVWHKLKVAGLALFLVGFVAAGLGWLSRSPAMAAEPAQARTAGQAPLASRAEPAATRPAPGRMIVGGRVLDPRGKPVPNASVIVHGSSRQGGDILRRSASAPAALGEAKCDGAGRFNIEMPRISRRRIT